MSPNNRGEFISSQATKAEKEMTEEEKQIHSWRQKMNDGCIIKTPPPVQVKRSNISYLPPNTMDSPYYQYYPFGSELNIHVKPLGLSEASSDEGERAASKILILLWFLVVIDYIEQSSFEIKDLPSISSGTNDKMMGFMQKIFGKQILQTYSQEDNNYIFSITVPAFLSKKESILKQLQDYMRQKTFTDEVKNLLDRELGIEQDS